MTSTLSESSQYAIDAHVHVWSDNLSRYPFAHGVKLSDVAVARYETPDILSEAQQNGVEKIVLIQMSYYGYDNRFLLDTIAQNTDRFRGIAVIDEGRPHLDLEMARLSHRGISGFRIIHLNAGEDLCRRPGLNRMFGYAAGQQLAMCLLISPDGIGAVDTLCRTFPSTTVVIDHMARIGFDGRIKEQHVKALCHLARYPRVMVKVSAFYALGMKQSPYDDLASLVHHLFEAFGPARLMWGSDSPFQGMQGNYHQSISFIRDRLDFLSAADKQHMLGTTAEELFFKTRVIRQG